MPLQGAKGYSITVANPSVRFTHPLYLGEAKTGISPFNGAVRIGGTLELGSDDTAVVEHRVNGIRRMAARYLREEVRGSGEQLLAGLRPQTPDGLPIIGRMPGATNLFVATGHGILGVTLSAVTGEAMAELMTTGKTAADLEPFAPGRFTDRPGATAGGGQTA